MDPDGNMAWFENLGSRGIKLGLDNMTELLERLGNPQEGVRFVHVAGTDGKGSVCAMIESILNASDIRAGAFTSPHIQKVNECIRLAGEDISDADLIDILSRVRPCVEDMASEGKVCTSFEVLTACALLYFKLVSVEIAVVEVGMGGRMDSTNVIVPEVSVINNIGMEHTAYLGNTIEEIAFEKAGIMKPDVPCVTINDGPALEVLMRRSEEIGAPLTQVSASEVEVVNSRPDAIEMIYRGELFEVALPGRHQAGNAALAIGAVSLLRDYEERIREHVVEGLATVSWPCRMQKMMAMPIVVDVTHTLAGAKCLARDVSEIYGKVVLVIGMLSDKDLDGVSRELAPIAERVFVTAPDSPRAASPETMADVMSKYHDDVTVVPTVADAMEAAMECREDLNVLVTGSFRTAEDVLRWFQERFATS